MKKETIKKKADKAIREYFAYRDACKKIQAKAVKELDKKNIDYYDVMCSYMPSDEALCLTIEFDVCRLPCVFLVEDFFEIIKKNEIDEEELSIYAI